MPASVGRSVAIRFRIVVAAERSLDRARDRQVAPPAHHDRLNPIVCERAGELGERGRRPALGAAVGGSRRERDERPAAVPSGAFQLVDADCTQFLGDHDLWLTRKTAGRV